MNKYSVALIAILLFGSANAADLSRYTASKLQQAQKYESSGDLHSAIQVLQSVENQREYDAAFVQQSLGVYYWKAGDLAQSIHHLTLAVNYDVLSEQQQQSTRQMLANLLFNQQQYQKALEQYYVLVRAKATKSSQAQLWLNIAKAHYQLKEWNNVITASNATLAAGYAKQIDPLSMKLAALVEQKEWQQAGSVLKRLLILEPNNAIWWRQLVNIELRAGNTKQALDALALADKQIELTAQERRLLASLYAHNGAPERAAVTLEHIDQARSELELIVEQAKYWQTAKELETAEHLWLKAARLDGQYYWQYVLVLTYQDKWQQALQSIDKVQNPTTETALLKVQILYALERVDQALSMAKSALDNTPDTQIENWIAFLEKVKLARQSSLVNKQKEGI